MKEFVSFVLGRSDQDMEAKKLNDLLKDTGVEVMIRTNEVIGYSILSVSVDKSEIEQKRKRNAGRHYKIYNKRYTCGEIREMQKVITNKDIAKKLGISIRTLYRRLKENSSYDDDREFL